MKYFVIPESRDDCAFSTVPDPMPLAETGAHIEKYLSRFEHQGYFSNCRQERIPLNELAFRIVPENESGGYFCLELGPDDRE